MTLSSNLELGGYRKMLKNGKSLVSRTNLRKNKTAQSNSEGNKFPQHTAQHKLFKAIILKIFLNFSAKDIVRRVL